MTFVLAFTNPMAPPPSNPVEALFFYVLLTPIGVVLQFLDHAFNSLAATSSIGAFGLAIVVITVAIRGLLFPLFRWQIRTQRKIQADQRRMGPELRDIQAKYKKDRARLQTETMALYKKHQINPLGQLSGCLPLVIQMPFLYALYGTIHRLSQVMRGHTHFLWIGNLGASAVHAGVLSHLDLLILPVLAGALTFMQSKMMMQQQRPDMTGQERQMYRVMAQTTYLMPVLIAVFAVTFYQGIALYWVTQSTVMVIQVFSVMGWGGLKVPSWMPGSERPNVGSVAVLTSVETSLPETEGTPERNAGRQDHSDTGSDRQPQVSHRSGPDRSTGRRSRTPRGRRGRR